MTFEEFFRKKKIDLAALEKAEPALLREFKTHFEQMGEKSFDHTKKYWFNKLRLSYHLAPEPKEEKVVIEKPLAEQTIIETLSETATAPSNAGFKPRLKAGMTKPAASPAVPIENTSASDPEKQPQSIEQPPVTPPALGFKPKFKAGVTKAVDESSNTKDLPNKESATVTPEVNKAAEEKDQNPEFEQEKAAAQQMADQTERIATQETPIDEPTQTSENKPAYKPRFKATNFKPKSPDE